MFKLYNNYTAAGIIVKEKPRWTGIHRGLRDRVWKEER
jgi:hypothetical protein